MWEGVWQREREMSTLIGMPALSTKKVFDVRYVELSWEHRRQQREKILAGPLFTDRDALGITTRTVWPEDEYIGTEYM